MRQRSVLSIAVLALSLSACGPDERVEVRTGDDVSASRAGDGTYQTYQLPLTGRDGETITTNLGLAVVGIVDSPVLDGVTLQATDVQWSGQHVVASYNVRGERFLGALQVIDVSVPESPRVIAEAVYDGTDLSNLRLAGDRIVAAGADVEVGGTLELFRIEGTELHVLDYVSLGSYAGTYVELSGYSAVASYGDRDGGVAWIDLSEDTPRLTSNIPLDDARWVSPLPEDGLVALAGTPGRLVRYAGATQADPAPTEVRIQGTLVGAPTWAERREDMLYISSDEAGLLVYDVEQLTPVGTLGTVGTANGSALSLDGRLAFLANGEEGLVVADIINPTHPVAVAQIDVADDSGSANAVALSEGYLALADGVAGVKLIAYERTVPGDAADCDGDGLADEEDPDDDEDGVLDSDDAAPCNPDVVCAPDRIQHQVRFSGDFFNLPCDHPDVDGRITGVVTGTLPWDFDWFDDTWYSFSLERDSLWMDYGENYFPVDNALCGDPFHFAVHWSTTAVATEAGPYTFVMGSDDDSWLFIDGQLVIDLGGIHAIAHNNATVELTAGPHAIDIYFAERHVVQSGLIFDVTALPSETARLEAIDHLCLDPDGDEDGDGQPNSSDMAPFVRPPAR